MIQRSKSPMLIMRDDRDLDLLGDAGVLPLRRVGTSTNGSTGVSTLVQDSLDAAILQVVGLVESSSHAGMVRLVSPSPSAVATEGSAEFVGAGGAR